MDRTLFYRGLQIVARPFLSIYFRHQTHGVDNIPDTSGAVIATNHASNLDPPLIGADVPRPLFTMAKKSLHETPGLGYLIRSLHSFPVRRGVLDTTALRTAVELLQSGNLVLMFPEGTRSSDGRLQEARPGVGKIVAEAGATVVPGYVSGTHRAMGKGSVFPKPVKTSVTFGDPLKFDDILNTETDRGDYEAISESIMDSIRSIKARVESSS
ncbi:MAG: lysophospholipid acyltransferase family protein [bacterium]